MAINFRHEAHDSLRRAKSELDSNNDDRLKYAVLELRMTMEALTYDRLDAYKAEIPIEELSVWQPKKVMQLLLNIDPLADKGPSLFVGEEYEYGVVANDMKFLGTETVLDIKTIKKYYDALSSFLHMPTLNQTLKSPAPDLVKLRDKCLEIVIFVETVLKSPIYNITLGAFSTIQCLRCKKPIRKRIPFNTKEVEATCLECGAKYTIHEADQDQNKWFPMQEKIDCPNKICDAKIYIWKDDIKWGTFWTCKTCGESYKMDLVILKMP